MRTCNITITYFDKDNPWSGILDAAAFAIRSTKSTLKGNSTCQLVFGHDMILPIKHKVDWELICKRKQTQNNKDNICKNRNRVDHDYKFGDKVMFYKHTA